MKKKKLNSKNNKIMKSSFKKKENPNNNKEDSSKAYFGLPEFDDILFIFAIFNSKSSKPFNFHTYF